MHANNQPPTEYRNTTVCTGTDPAERQRRLDEAYTLLLDLAQRKRVVAQAREDQSLTRALKTE